MQTLSLHADARADARESARPDLLERRLKRFQPRFQPRVRALAERHPRLKDLALSFPALLFALAVPRAGFDPASAMALVIGGARLRDVAACARVPLWLRRFGPEAFGEPMPLLPEGELSARQIVNHLPTSPQVLTWWLENVGNAARWADDAVAVWVAREVPHARVPPAKQGLRLVCLWAWYSRNGLVSAPDTAWTPSTKLHNALGAAVAWQERLQFRLSHRGPTIEDMWLAPGSFDGLSFVPLDTYEAISAEAVAMRNCLMGYLKNLARGECRLWSIQRDGQRVATLEIRIPWDGPLLYVSQVKAMGNATAPPEVWRAARAWLDTQDVDSAGRTGRERARQGFDRGMWIAFWRPYWLAKRRFPGWLPLAASPYALRRL